MRDILEKKMKLLKNKKILLCVSGSIAIYKALELLRLYTKAGAYVKVLMSEGAKEFINPITFEALSFHEVLHESTSNWHSKNNHIDASKEADIVVFAPATANSINKFANGIADNLLTQTLIANKKPLLIAPAMNTNMYNNFATQKSLKYLAQNGINIVEPTVKELACKDEGKGALADVEDIFYNTCKLLMRDDFWIDKNVIVTGGGTKENIDDVRFIGNFSSGKMAKNLALALFLKGANVKLLTSAHEEKMPFPMETFNTSDELKTLLTKHSKKADFLFMAAAVSDYVSKEKASGKLKKKELGSSWNLELVQNEDILKSLPKKGLTTIGFKAEFDEKNALKNAKNMLKEKSLDGVCLNILGKKVNFGSEKTQMQFITKNGVKKLPFDEKLAIALEIVNEAKSINA